MLWEIFVDVGFTIKLETHLTSSRQNTIAYGGRRRDYLYDSAVHGWGVTDGVEAQCNMHLAERG